MRKLIGLIVVAVLAVYLFWPHHSSSYSASHVSAAMKYHNQAAKIVNKGGMIMSAEDANQILELYKKALAEADQADIAEMNKYHPGFGDHFRDEFIAGLRLIVNSPNATIQQMRGQALRDRFGEWYQGNLKR